MKIYRKKRKEKCYVKINCKKGESNYEAKREKETKKRKK